MQGHVYLLPGQTLGVSLELLLALEWPRVDVVRPVVVVATRPRAARARAPRGHARTRLLPGALIDARRESGLAL